MSDVSVVVQIRPWTSAAVVGLAVGGWGDRRTCFTPSNATLDLTAAPPRRGKLFCGGARRLRSAYPTSRASCSREVARSRVTNKSFESGEMLPSSSATSRRRRRDAVRERTTTPVPPPHPPTHRAVGSAHRWRSGVGAGVGEWQDARRGGFPVWLLTPGNALLLGDAPCERDEMLSAESNGPIVVILAPVILSVSTRAWRSLPPTYANVQHPVAPALLFVSPQARGQLAAVRVTRAGVAFVFLSTPDTDQSVRYLVPSL